MSCYDFTVVTEFHYRVELVFDPGNDGMIFMCPKVSWKLNAKRDFRGGEGGEKPGFTIRFIKLI